MYPQPSNGRESIARAAPKPEEDSAVQAGGSRRKILALVCVSGILLLRTILACAYATTLPLGAGADEAAHFAYVEFFATYGYGELPREFWRQAGQAPEPSIGAGYESHQPPLYYALVSLPLYALRQIGMGPDFASLTVIEHDAVVYGFVPPGAIKEDLVAEPILKRDWYLARLFSALLGLLPTCAAYLIGRQIWRAYPPSVTMAAIVAFTPQMVYMNAAISNDILAIGVGGLAIRALVKATGNRGLRSWVGCGLWIGLGLLTKFTIVTLVLSILPAIVLWPQPGRRKLMALVSTVAAMLLISGGYFAYRYTTTGDPTGMQSSAELYARYGGAMDRSLNTARVATDLIWTFESAWSLPASPSPIFLSKWFYFGFALLTLTALWGAGSVLLKPPPTRRAHYKSLVLVLLVAVIQIAIYAFVYIVADLRVNLNQGRFLYLGWYALAASLAFATSRLPWLRDLPPYLVTAALSAGLALTTWVTLQYFIVPFLQS